MFNWLSHWIAPNRSRAASGLGNVAPHLQAVAQHNAFMTPAAPAHTSLYHESSWVYVSVNRIAEAAALVPLHVYRLDGERRLEVERHPLEALLDAPNPFTSRFELLEQTIGMLELTGNAYWFLAGDSRGLPAEIWPLHPDRVSIVPDPARHVRGYVYELDGQRIPLDAAEVVHFKRWHPTNDYYGLSALQAARLAISSDRVMAEWNRSTFGQDNGVPAGIVSIKEYVSDADFERIKREWRASYGGPQRRTAFLRGGSVEWKNIGLSHSELDFLQGRRAHRDEILNIFGIPVGLVSDNATEANARVAERTFIERTLWPKLVRLGQKITQELLPFYPGAHLAEFEDIRPTDTRERLDEIRAAYPVLSVNEIRARYYRLPPVAWGELPTQQQSILPPPPPTTSGAAGSGAAGSGAKAELDRWERFALKRWGRTAGRPFAVRDLPDDLAFEVSAGLLAAEDTSQARAIFAAARAQVMDAAVNPLPGPG